MSGTVNTAFPAMTPPPDNLAAGLDTFQMGVPFKLYAGQKEFVGVQRVTGAAAIAQYTPCVVDPSTGIATAWDGTTGTYPTLVSMQAIPAGAIGPFCRSAFFNVDALNWPTRAGVALTYAQKQGAFTNSEIEIGRLVT